VRPSARPSLRIPRTNGERAFELTGLVVLLSWLGLVARTWRTLPERVPVHFDAFGTPNGWAGRGAALLLPVVGSSLYVVLSVLQRFPRLYNYPVRVTAHNAERLYRLGRQLLLSVKLILTCAFTFLFFSTVRVARGEASALTPWFLPAFLLPLLAMTSVFLIKMLKAK
jgi:uncharacterized membrane protein